MSATAPTFRIRQPPRWLQRLFSPLAKAVLRSPLHGLLSQRLLLLTFTGRTSGQSFSTPVLYEQTGDTLLLRAGGAWWKNLRGGVTVRVLLRGNVRAGRAEAGMEEGGLVPVKIHLNEETVGSPSPNS
jgi:hypothetical protein